MSDVCVCVVRVSQCVCVVRVCVCCTCVRVSVSVSVYKCFRFSHFHIFHCTDKDFNYINDAQPIGENLFKQFCHKKPHLKCCMEFLEAVVRFF